MRSELFSDKQLIEGVIESKTKEIEYLYIKVKPRIKSYIIAKGGKEQEADDAFHDGLLNVFIKLKENKKAIKTNIEGYLFISCKNSWLIEKQNRKREDELLNEYFYLNKIDYILSDNKRSNKKIFRAFKKLSVDCKNIFKLQQRGYSYLQISETIKISVKSVKTKRARCFKQLHIILNSNNDKQK